MTTEAEVSRAAALTEEAMMLLGDAEPGRKNVGFSGPADARIEASGELLAGVLFLLESAEKGDYPDSERLVWAIGKVSYALHMLGYAVGLERAQEKYPDGRADV